MINYNCNYIVITNKNLQNIQNENLQRLLLMDVYIVIVNIEKKWKLIANGH